MLSFFSILDSFLFFCPRFFASLLPFISALPCIMINLVQRMAPGCLILSFILLAFTAVAQDPEASPWQIAFNTTTSIGPDGKPFSIHQGHPGRN
jgi:hypothetical protein